MPITFPVDDVTIEGDPYSIVPLDTTLPARIGPGLRASCGPASVIGGESLPELPVENDGNQFVAAVHLAFAKHRPLILSPDAVWTTIAQAFSVHVQLHAEELRSRFVRHEGKLELKVDFFDREIGVLDWPPLVANLTGQIAGHVGPALHADLVNDFSTTGSIERTVSEIVMMETFNPYFDYVINLICGIPEVTLTGTVDDWKSIRRRLDTLAGYGLEDWIALLAPVADEWVKTAEGHPDRDFWQCMYMPEETYGSELVTGWLQRLFPYLRGDDGFVRNGSLFGDPPGWGDPVNEMERAALAAERAERGEIPGPRSRWQHEGVPLSAFGNGLSVAPVTIRYVGNRTKERLQLIGGFLGVTQQPESLALEPKLGWCVRFDRVGTAVAHLAETSKPRARGRPRDAHRRPSLFAIPAAYTQLLDRLVDTPELFDGAWSLRMPEGIDGVSANDLPKSLGIDAWTTVQQFIDLPRGRWLAWCADRDRWWVVAGADSTFPSLDSPVIASDLVELFELALRDGPLYFDSPSFTPSRTFRDVLRHQGSLRE